MFKKKNNNNQRFYKVDYGAYVKTMRIRFVHQDREGAFWPVFEN